MVDARISRHEGTSSGAGRRFMRWVRGMLGSRPPPDAAEDTGIWGVGGPAMREPGSTGILRALRVPREDSAD